MPPQTAFSLNLSLPPVDENESQSDTEDWPSDSDSEKIARQRVLAERDPDAEEDEKAEQRLVVANDTKLTPILPNSNPELERQMREVEARQSRRKTKKNTQTNIQNKISEWRDGSDQIALHQRFRRGTPTYESVRYTLHNNNNPLYSPSSDTEKRAAELSQALKHTGKQIKKQTPTQAPTK